MDRSNPSLLVPNMYLVVSRFIVGSDDCETNLCAARFAATEDGATEVNFWKSSRNLIQSVDDSPFWITLGTVFEKCNYIFALIFSKRRSFLSFSFLFVPPSLLEW